MFNYPSFEHKDIFFPLHPREIGKQNREIEKNVKIGENEEQEMVVGPVASEGT